MRAAGVLLVCVLLSGCVLETLGLRQEAAPAPLAPPALSAPADDARRLDPREVRFSWSVPANATGPIEYRLLVDDEPACVTSATECVVRGLAQGAAHAWRVEAILGDVAATSLTRSFRTDAAPTPPAFPPGADDARQLPLATTVAARASADADGDALRYVIDVRDASGALVARCADLAVPECDVVLPRHGARYDARVTVSDGILDATSVLTFTTRVPVVLVHGFLGDATTWTGLPEALEADGYDVVDFGPDPGTQTLVYAPGGAGFVRTAADVVAPAIEAALVAEGYAPDQPIDVIAHSMGGLVARVLVEKAGATVDDDGPVEVPARWATQVRTLALLATPHRGTTWAEGCHGDDWGTLCRQAEPGSAFLSWLGVEAGPHAPRYRTVVGDADAVVSERSASLDDVPLVLLDRVCHSNSMGWGVFCDHPVVRAPGTLAVLDELLGPQPGR